MSWKYTRVNGKSQHPVLLLTEVRDQNFSISSVVLSPLNLSSSSSVMCRYFVSVWFGVSLGSVAMMFCIGQEHGPFPRGPLNFVGECQAKGASGYST